jgi:hypothetical protein
MKLIISDNCDLSGFEVISDEEYEYAMENINKKEAYPLEFYYGDGYLVVDFYEPKDVIELITVHDITEEEAHVFEKFFDYSYFGNNIFGDISVQISESD